MMRLALVTAVGALMTLGACDGPREQAGEVADNQSGAVGSEDTLRSGPQESLGERQDEANESVSDAREARADALEEQADAQRAQADEQADRIDEQAERVRKGE